MIVEKEMTFMAIFAIAILALVLLAGVAALAGGIVGLCLLRRKTFSNKGLVIGLLIALIVVGAFLILLPVGIVGYVMWTNFLLDATTPETGITIEEEGYPGYTFTADGVVYEMLPIYPDFDYCFDHSEPIFTYNWQGVLGQNYPGTLSRVENPQNFDLIWNDCDTLYCPAQQVDEVMAYYSSQEDIQWTYFSTSRLEDDDWDSIHVSEDHLETVQTLPEIWCSPVEAEKITQDTTELWITANIDDDIVIDMSFTVALTETDAYLIRREETVPTDTMDELVQYGIPLADELFPIFESMANAK